MIEVKSMNNKLKNVILAAVIMSSSAILSSCSLLSKNGEDYIYYGTAEADQINITAEVSGKIKAVKVQEGKKVDLGDLVAIIDSDESKLKLEQADVSLKNSQNELDKVNDGNRTEDIKAQEAAVSQAEAAVMQGKSLVTKGQTSVEQSISLVNQSKETLNQAQSNLEVAQKNYDYKNKIYNDTKELYENGVETKYNMDNAKNALDNAKNTLDTAKYSVENAKAQLDSNNAQLEGAKASLEGNNAQLDGYTAQLEGAQQKLNLLVNGATDKTKLTAQYGVDQAKKSYDLTKLQLDKSNVLAAVDGTIEQVNFKPGEYVTPGSPIVTMLDTKNMWVKVYVPESLLPSIKLGKEVTLTSDFIKGKTIKGEISYISSEAEFTPMNVVTKKDRMKLVYGVKIKILDNLDSIKSGMLFNVNLK